jgi:hypothetical protein
VETFVPFIEPVENPDFAAQRGEALADVDADEIDAPIVQLITGFADLPYCYTLQCCHGHFVRDSDTDDHTLARLPDEPRDEVVLYRIAYVTWCIDTEAEGMRLMQDLRAVAAAAPGLVQFGCATWFWERQVNSYVLQVEPERFAHLDKTPLGYGEALRVQAARDDFFVRLAAVLDAQRAALPGA